LNSDLINQSQSRVTSLVLAALTLCAEKIGGKLKKQYNTVKLNNRGGWAYRT
jgi:hypothetical protein